MMTKPKIMTVYGTRPEAIKVAPLIKALADDDRFKSILVSTGQHQEMLEQAERGVGLRPDLKMSVMRSGQSLNSLVARIIRDLDTILELHQPDLVVVQGDTSTAMSAALAAFQRGIRVAHLEAGLRTGDLTTPFPEEANRKIIGQLSSLHLAPTETAKTNLLHEGVEEDAIYVVGNTVLDALQLIKRKNISIENEVIFKAIANGQRIVTVTTHRRENFKDLAVIGEAIQRLAADFHEYLFVLPLHQNPLVRDELTKAVGTISNVFITKPLSYPQFIELLSNSSAILTDSGGVQEEAPSLGVPVIVMREKTERNETVLHSLVKTVSLDSEQIYVTMASIINSSSKVLKTVNTLPNPYGDGRAATRALAAITKLFELSDNIEDFGVIKS